jgi:plastocyanin
VLIPGSGAGIVGVLNIAVAIYEAGTFRYHCSIHPFMTGTVTVR